MFINEKIIRNLVKKYDGCTLEDIDNEFAIITCDIKITHIEKMTYQMDGSIFDLIEKISKADNIEHLINETYDLDSNNPYEYLTIMWKNI